MSHVFHRSGNPITAVRAEGCWVYDSEGKAYLDAAGGAVVVSVGHGDPAVVAALAHQAGTLGYVHPTVFTTTVVEAYANDLAPLVPVHDAKVFPTSGGAEAVETALKLARSYHLARGEKDRSVVISRTQSYHGNTIGALDVSGRPPLRMPYLPWLGRSVQVPAVSEYRCPAPDHPAGCAEWHAKQLERAIITIGPDRVAAFIGEAIGGATLGAAAPPPEYWAAIIEVCRHHGVLVIDDEVMTGFGRTGRWFGIDHYDVQPDIIVAAKGVASGYWPTGLCVSSGEIHETVRSHGGFRHGFTFSHAPIGAAVAHAVLKRLIEDDLVARAAHSGKRLLESLTDALSDVPSVGDVRGVGLLLAVELVSDRDTKTPFPASDAVAERVAAAARYEGLLVYPSVGAADGENGDVVLLGPPLIVSDEEMTMIVDRLERAIVKATA
jgi:adenosylmethionine-8-amino-7-oxononanoate aminotransferase